MNLKAEPEVGTEQMIGLKEDWPYWQGGEPWLQRLGTEG